jgi:hypothetical protein
MGILGETRGYFLGTNAGLRPGSGEILGLCGIAAVYFVASMAGHSSVVLINVLGPLALIWTITAGGWGMLQADSRNIWSPLFWFRISTAAYFGVGMIIPFIVNATSLRYIQGFHYFSAEDILKLNLIVTLSFLFILIGALLVDQYAAPGQAGRVSDRVADPGADRGGAASKQLLDIGLLLLAVGGAIRYLIILPNAIGWIPGTLPGAVSSLSALALAGIYLVTLWSLRNSFTALLLITLFTLFHMFSGLILFTKTEVLIPLIVYLIAILSDRIAWPRIAFAVGSVLLFLALLNPLVSYGRDRFNVLAAYGATEVGVGPRVQILGAYFNDRPASDGEQIQNSLIRLSYVNAATLGVARYDEGYPGNSMRSFWAVFIPRFIWRDKPTLGLGQEFAAMATGVKRNNSVSPGLYGEAYWNFGWWGIPLLMTPLGAILYLLSSYAITVLRRGEWVLLPVLFMGMNMGLRSDGQYVPDIVGTAVIIFFMHLIIRNLASFVAPRLQASPAC